jgi:hypothetical protein
MKMTRQLPAAVCMMFLIAGDNRLGTLITPNDSIDPKKFNHVGPLVRQHGQIHEFQTTADHRSDVLVRVSGP